MRELYHVAACDAEVARVGKALIERQLSDNRQLGNLLREEVLRSEIKRLVEQVDRQKKEIERLRSEMLGDGHLFVWRETRA